MKFSVLALLTGLVAASAFAADKPDAPAPATDRVGFPEGYKEKYTVLRSINRTNEAKVVIIYGNDQAATVKQSSDLPYPDGSVIVMETSSTIKDAAGNFVVDAKGIAKPDKVLGMHVMRREKGFGEAYGENRSGEWEYVEYRADKSYFTPPQKSASCSECHIKAGAKRDYVYRGRLPEDGK